MYGFIIPKQGWSLLTKLLAGDTLQISDILVGNGRLPDGADPYQLTDLVNPIAAATSTVPTVSERALSFTIEYRNDMNGGLENGFWLNEYGVYAIDPDIGRILLYYGTLGDFPQYVSPYSGGSRDVRRFPVVIGLTDDLNVEIDYIPTAFMTAQDVSDYFNSTIMPQMIATLQELIRVHNEDQNAHPFILAQLADVTGRIGRLEDMILNDVTGNTFMVTFGNLNGVVVSGVWNTLQQRIEF